MPGETGAELPIQGPEPQGQRRPDTPQPPKLDLPEGVSEYDLKPKSNLLNGPGDEGYDIYVHERTGQEFRVPKPSEQRLSQALKNKQEEIDQAFQEALRTGKLGDLEVVGHRIKDGFLELELEEPGKPASKSWVSSNPELARNRGGVNVLGGGQLPEQPILSPEALELAHRFYEDVLNVRVVELTPEAQAAFANAMRWANNPREMIRDVNVMAQGFSNFDSLSGKAREEAVGRMQRGVQEGFYGFNLAYTLNDWLRQDPSGNVVRQNVDALIASAEAYPDKEINQQLLGELLQALTTVLRRDENLRETLRAKVESRYKIHNLNLLAKYVDGEKRGPGLTAIYGHEAASLIHTNGVYLALKILERHRGVWYRTADNPLDAENPHRKKDLVVNSQLELIKAAKRLDDPQDENSLNRGGFGYQFNEGFTEEDVKEALKKMYDARDKDVVGIGPSTLAVGRFPGEGERTQREAFERLLSEVRVAFDIADKTAVGVGLAADSARIYLKDSANRPWVGKGDLQVWKTLMDKVPLEFEGKVIDLRALLDLKAKLANGETLSSAEQATLNRDEPILAAAIRQNSNLIPMAFATAKQKIMERYWDDIDFANVSPSDGGREIGVEFWHNVRQELGGSRNVALKGVRRFNDTAQVNLVDAAGEGSMTDLLIKWGELYNSAVRPMEKRARVGRKLHDMLVEDEPYLFKEIKSLFGHPVKALEAIRKKAIGGDLHEIETDRLMGTYADGALYANQQMFDQTGGLYERKNSLGIAYMLKEMIDTGVVTPKKASELFNKHIGRFGIFKLLFESFGFTAAFWDALKQFGGAAVSTK